ncbi:hypothetical protein [Aestuariispira insulae]|uniref:Uncharacterized protein n=1 Tax=Aestuariispira insulae TaxID=1461337 RepID=A0A3D9H1N7_9PROT|nr:hypothetical protein [Aestuariispira insulae]RED43081.1 hypothetical protein DFP90_1372 [Aestuariispira insulae]
MNIPEWLKPGIYGMVLGAVVLAVVGFSWGGWMTSGQAIKVADTMADDAVIAALLPICIDSASTDINRTMKIGKIREAADYKRRDALMEAGWATVPGETSPNRDLAKACLDALNIEKQ